MAAIDYVTSFILLLMVSLINFTSADPQTELVARACSRTRAAHTANYIVNFNRVVAEMEEKMLRNKFGTAEEGDEPPDRVYLFAQCMTDLSAQECVTCFNLSKHALAGCLPNTGGRALFDGCFIRAENYSFFEEIIQPNDLKRCSDNADYKDEKFNQTAVKVINSLVELAAENDGFAVAEDNSNEFTVFAMANCWRILDPDKCSSCVEIAAKRAISCLPSSEGRVLNSGCVLRYSDSDFGNKPHTIEIQESALKSVSYVIGSLALCALCTVIILVGFCAGISTYRRIRRQRKSNAKGMERELTAFNHSSEFLHFKYSTLVKATECFNETHKLGQGAYGEVFKGTLPDGREIAIKRLFISGQTQTQEVYNEIDIISKAQHKNLVRFLGCCFTNINCFLIYEFLANKSLDLILFAIFQSLASSLTSRLLFANYLRKKDQEKKEELDWKKRLGIIVGTAEGLEYLQKDCQVRIVHRDIKASNILLDLKHRPKIADFGLARFYSCEKSFSSTAIAGTIGYIAPEYLAHGRLTEKVDVYSFGILLLEIVSGVRNNKFQPENPLQTLVTDVWQHVQNNKIYKIIDKSMEIEDIEEMKRVVQVGLLCTQESPDLRPTMTSVIQMLRRRDFALPAPSKPPFLDFVHMKYHHH